VHLCLIGRNQQPIQPSKVVFDAILLFSPTGC
jgi:hypothetical protein